MHCMAYHKFDCKDNANRAQNKMKSSFFFLEASYLRFSSCFILLSTRLFVLLVSPKVLPLGKENKNFVFYFAFHSLIRTFAR